MRGSLVGQTLRLPGKLAPRLGDIQQLVLDFGMADRFGLFLGFGRPPKTLRGLHHFA